MAWRIKDIFLHISLLHFLELGRSVGGAKLHHSLISHSLIIRWFNLFCRSILFDCQGSFYHIVEVLLIFTDPILFRYVWVIITSQGLEVPDVAWRNPKILFFRNKATHFPFTWNLFPFVVNIFPSRIIAKSTLCSWVRNNQSMARGYSMWLGGPSYLKHLNGVAKQMSSQTIQAFTYPFYPGLKITSY